MPKCSPKLGIIAYREGVVALMGLIDDHFPKDNTDVQLAKVSLLISLGQLKYAQMELEEKVRSKTPNP